MRCNRTRLLVTGAAVLVIGVCAEVGFSLDQETSKDPVDASVAKGLKWLASTQGKDGGWGQDGGETSYVRQGERLESNGNDVANTAVAAEAMLHTGTTPTHGQYREPLQRAVEFVLKHVEESPIDGLAVTDLHGTQIQRKLGPYIDTFMAAKLLAELDGDMGDAKANARVRVSLQKCVAKIEKNQLKDGSWNIAGGWAPVLGTSMASQSLAMAQAKGAANPQVAMERVELYSLAAAAPPPPASGGGGSAGRMTLDGALSGGVASTVTVTGASTAETVMVTGGDAGVSLYSKAQQLEQLSRTDNDRKKNAKQIQVLNEQLKDARVVTGFGSIGGEEFFSWLNISESLHRTGGEAWAKWNGDMKTKLIKLQNDDGTWAGHHCITGRVAVTSAAILLLKADREPVVSASVASPGTKTSASTKNR